MVLKTGRNAINAHICISICLLISLMVGCVATTELSSTPQVQTKNSPDYMISFEPVKTSSGKFTAFILSIKNLMDSPMAIDWNSSLYIHNNQNRGGFIFEGISPEEIKDGNIPETIILPKTTFLKRIAPQQLIAFSPLRDKSVKAGSSGITGGPIPEGDNGILLVLNINGNTIKEVLTLTLNRSR